MIFARVERSEGTLRIDIVVVVVSGNGLIYGPTLGDLLVVHKHSLQDLIYASRLLPIN